MKMNCIVWGAGSLGRRLKEVLEGSEINIKGFSDSDITKQGYCVDGLPIYSLDVLTEYYFSGELDFIIIAIKNRKEAILVMQKLYNLGILNIKYAPEYLQFYNLDKEKIMDEFLDLKDMKPELNRIEVHVTENCNLNCKGCGHFSNLSGKEPIYLDLQEFKAGVEYLRNFYENINEFYLMGGEPLLNPDLHLYIQIVRNIFTNSKIIVVTNGLLVDRMSPQIIEALRYNRAVLDISLYAPTIKKIYSINKFLFMNSLEYNLSTDDKSYFFRYITSNENHDSKSNFDQCIGRNCHMLSHGRIYTCAAASNIEIFNKRFNMSINEGMEDYIDLCKFKGTGWDINRYLSKPLNMCRWCNTRQMDFFKWQSGGAINKEDWLNPND